MSSNKSKARRTIRVSLLAWPRLSRILDGLRKHYEKVTDKDCLVVPFVVTCAVALEARLNDELVNYAHSKWDWDEPALAQSLLTMNLRSKLNALVPLLTEHRFQFNRNHFVYRRLNSLISVRNALVHPKPFEHDFPVSHEVHPLGYPVLDGYVEVADDLTLGKVREFGPLEYHEALEKLDKWFFKRLPDHISKVAMLVANKHA